MARFYIENLEDTLADATILQLRQQLAIQTQLLQEKRLELDILKKLRSLSHKVTPAQMKLMLNEIEVHGRVDTLPSEIFEEMSAVQDQPLPPVAQPFLDDEEAQAMRSSPRQAALMRRRERAMYDNETTLDFDLFQQLWDLVDEPSDEEYSQAARHYVFVERFNVIRLYPTRELALAAEESAKNKTCNKANMNADQEMPAVETAKQEVEHFACFKPKAVAEREPSAMDIE